MSVQSADDTEKQTTEHLEHHADGIDADRMGATHKDEAKELDGSVTSEEERRLVRKFDWNIMPLVYVLYMLSFLDRSNIGNANTAGMSADLGLSSSQYEWLLTIFYLGYILGQPTTLLWKVVPAHIYATVLTVCWGGFALLQAACTNWGGLMALRFFLGVAETAFGPGVPYYLSFFYLRREVGFRQGIFLGAAPIATAYAGTLAYGLTHIKGASIANWRVLFLVEGAPAILVIPFVWFFLPDTASHARFLTEDQKAIARARGVRQGDEGREQGLDLRHVWKGLGDLKAWITALMYFSCNVSFSSLPVFLPTILSEMGFSSIRAQGLTAPPYLASFFVLMTASYLSDRLGDRSGFIIPLAAVGGIGYVVLATVESTAVRYFAVYLAAAGIFPCIALILPWVSNMHGSDSKRGAGFMLLNLIGQCGPLLGTRLYPKHEGPYYVKGMSVSAAFMFFVAILASVLRLALVRENRRRDREYGKSDGQHTYADLKGTADDDPNFRYIL